MSDRCSFDVAGEAAMLEFGASLSECIRVASLVYLEGQLGAGKTTLVRGILRGLGYSGAVRSPTYTLMEPYRLQDLDVLHLDLYRLGDAEELEWLGLRDELGVAQTTCLVEWPERGAGWLPPPDLSIQIKAGGSGRRVRLEAADNSTVMLKDCVSRL